MDEILDSITIDYIDVDMAGYTNYYTSEHRYLLDRETVRHALYETIARSFLACHFTYVGWAESKRTRDLYEKLRHVWPIVGKNEVLFNQHFPNLDYRRLLETKDIWEHNINEYDDGISQHMHLVNHERMGSRYGSWPYPENPTTSWYPARAPIVMATDHPGASPPRSRI
jgi:hypothetical protein